MPPSLFCGKLQELQGQTCGASSSPRALGKVKLLSVRWGVLLDVDGELVT